MSKIKFRLGSDPEVFLIEGTSPKSVCGLIGADKWNPFQVPDMPPGFTFQEDNVALEFGIPPAASADEFVKHIKAVQERFLKQYKHLTFSNLSCIVFPDSEMNSPGAHIFGCEPDFNAWTGLENKKPNPPVPNMRSAGGHIHIETKLDKRSVVKAMDLTAGVPSVLMDNGKERRKLYGGPGCFRPKSYGVEYRTLSNFWIFEEKYIRWAWNATERALQFVKTPRWQQDYEEIDAEAVQHCIAANDKHLAMEIVDVYNLEVV